ncbi:restriction endonuclease subunit S [Nocardiopsis sp. NPDC007018]|uniref:restriction endonuclease subunit S n=1 Tax=Nocardiopsis sp. NPDC007018 TaxID=3155721 RepID=UPI0034076DB5
MKGWIQKTWGEIATLEYGKALRGYQNANGTVRVFGTNGPVGWHNIPQSEGPGVIIGRKGAYRGVHYTEHPFWVIDTAYYLSPKTTIDLKWCYYSLKNTDINTLQSGSAVPSTSRADFYATPALIPPKHEQQAIATALSALDDKIAANERISESTEELCRHLVEASATATPRVSVDSLCNLSKAQATPSSLTHPFIKHYSLPAFDKGKLPETDQPTTIKSNKFIINSPSVLISKLNPNTPRVWNIPKVDGTPCLASTEFLVLEPSEGVSTHELWAVLSQPGFTDRLASRVTGTSKSHQRVRPAEIMSAKVVDPRALGPICEQITGLASKSVAAIEESRTLAELRDTLLPQLMSGKLRVKDAERIVEDNA